MKLKFWCPLIFYFIFSFFNLINLVFSSLLCKEKNCELNPQVKSCKAENPDDPICRLESPEQKESYECDPNKEKCISLTYGGGYLKGKMMTGSVWIDNLEVPKQEVAAVTHEDESSTLNFSCLIGLGFPELAPHGELLLFDNMMKQKLLAKNLFTSYYYKDKEHSALYFGDIKKEYYEGDIHWIDVHKRYHWNIKIDDVKIDGKPLGACKKFGYCQGLVDTGTNKNSFEEEQYKAVMSHYDGSVCQEEGLPTLTYVIDGKDYTFESKDYYDEEGVKCTSLFKMDVFKNDAPAMVLGVSFMEKYFTIYDRTDDAHPRIGFALASDLKLDKGAFEEVDSIPDNVEKVGRTYL